MWRLLVIASAWLLVIADARAADGCSPTAGLNFVCGPANAEDLLELPGSRWVVASGMSGPESPSSQRSNGHVYALDVTSRTAVEVFPGAQPALEFDREAYPTCPGLLDPNHFSAHGLALLPTAAASARNAQRLFVTSHGAREAVEVFDIHLPADGGTPQLAWRGCVPIPAHNDVNSVAALADGSLLITRISGTGPNASGNIFAAEPTGFLYQWDTTHGLREVSNTSMSGPNGIIVSADGSLVYVGAWGSSEIVRFGRDAKGVLRRDRALATGFRVDNLRWTARGTLLAAGHRLAAQQNCGDPLCMDAWEVVEVDAELTSLRSLGSYPSLPGFLGATAAIEVGDTLWLGTFHGDRIAYRQLATPALTTVEENRR